MAKDKVEVEILTEAKKSITSLVKYAAVITVATKAVQALINLGKESVDAYKEQELAERKLTAALKATNNAVGITADEMYKYAESLSSVTVYGDEAIIGAEALLVTFTKIGKETFPEALEAAADMSTMFGQDLQQSVIQLGTALNDPIAGVGRLKRIGVSFSQTQTEMIAKFMAQNDIMSAQNVILDELKNEFGGVAREVGGSSIGTLDRFSNSIGDLKEAFGELLVDGMNPFVNAMTEITKSVTAAIKANKDYNEMQKRIDDGSASSADHLTDLKDKLEQLNYAYKEGLISSEGLNFHKEEVESIKKQIEYYTVLEGVEKRIIEKQEAAKKAQREKAEAEAASAQLAQDNLEKLDEAFGKTKEGQLEALNENIKFFESFKKSEKAKTVLEDLYLEHEKLTAELNNNGQAIEGMSEAAIEFYNLDKTESQRAIENIEEQKQKYIDGGVERVDAEIWAQEEIGKIRDAETEKEKQRAEELKQAYAQVYTGMANLGATAFQSLADASEEGSKKQKQLAIIAFNFQKAAAIGEAFMNGKVAATKAYATLGPIFGPIAAGAIAGLTAVNIAGIVAQKAPSFVTGVRNYQVPNSVGTDQSSIRVSAGEKVTVKNRDQVTNEGNGNNILPINLNIDGRMFGQILFDLSTRKALTIDSRAVVVT